MARRRSEAILEVLFRCSGDQKEVAVPQLGDRDVTGFPVPIPPVRRSLDAVLDGENRLAGRITKPASVDCQLAKSDLAGSAAVFRWTSSRAPGHSLLRPRNRRCCAQIGRARLGAIFSIPTLGFVLEGISDSCSERAGLSGWQAYVH
jgi:hypothetical protein